MDAWKFSEIRILTEKSESVSYRAGDVLFRQGDPGDNVLLIRRGLVEIYSDAYGSHRRLALRGRGELIGEMALLDNLGRSATAVARTDVEARALGRKAFEELLESTPAMFGRLTRMISRRLRELQDTLVSELERQHKGWKDAGLKTIGTYQLQDQLGQGGMGVIYRAIHERTGALRAVKVLPVPNDEQRARFTRECQMMARLVHPNIVRITDAGLEGPFGYLAMELLEGESLEQRLTRGPLSQQEALDWFIPALEALDHAHSRDIMHRDIKPGNLFMTTEGPPSIGAAGGVSKGVLKLLDFGVARREHDPSLTTSDNCFGTPRYLAPERIGGHSQSLQKQSDQYSAGVTLYHAITGRPPFDSEDVAEILSAHLYQAPLPPSQLVPVSFGFEAVILKMLQKEPLRRYPSLLAAAKALTTSEEPTQVSSVTDKTVDLGIRARYEARAQEAADNPRSVARPRRGAPLLKPPSAPLEGGPT